MKKILPEKEKILNEIFTKYNGDLINRITTKKHLIKGNNKLFYFFNNKSITENEPIDNVKVFEVPITNYKCSINEKGRNKYGKIENIIFKKDSSVGTEYGDIELPEVRRSKHFKSFFEFEGNNIDEIVTTNLQSISKDKIKKWNIKQKYTVLEYKEGDFFTEHTDNNINKKHFGTLLIFPPAVNTIEHTGGDLIIENGVWDIVIPSSNNKKWKFIVLKTNLKHACMKVLTGRRVILKTELFTENKVDYNEEDLYCKICVDQGISYFSEED